MEISVIMPVYKVEKYLRQAIDSVLAQTFKDFELIIVDDGSPDNCPAICDEYAKKDSRVKVIHKENGGYGKAMNAGLKVASGAYIAILESDDFAEANMLESLYKAIVENSAEISRGNYYQYNNETKENRLIRVNNFEGSYCITNVAEKPSILLNSIAHWANMYRREFLIANNIWFNESPGASYQDTGFFVKAMLAANVIAFTNIPVLHYRMLHGGNSVASTDKQFCLAEEYDSIVNWLKCRKSFTQAAYAALFSLMMQGVAFTCYRVKISYIKSVVERHRKAIMYIFGLIVNYNIDYSVMREFNNFFLDTQGLERYIRDRQSCERRQARRKMFSLRINGCGVGLKVCGYKLINIGDPWKLRH